LEIDEQTARKRTEERARADFGDEFFKRRSQAFFDGIVQFQKVLGDKLLTFDATLPIEKLHEQIFLYL
jgi:thymidylate kinase